MTILKGNCCICGREANISSHKQIYCAKHYKQLQKYGHCVDSNPRTIHDPNEIIVDGNITYIKLYDRNCNEVAITIIDSEDLLRVQALKWRLCNGYARSSQNKKIIHLSRFILGTDQFVDHINHNTLDNRKCNLRIVSKSQNQMNCNYKGISRTKFGKFYAYIKINQKQINLGTYANESDALFARWYAEIILFKEYRFP